MAPTPPLSSIYSSGGGGAGLAMVASPAALNAYSRALLFAAGNDNDNGGTFSRSYKLPKCKLQALTELMVRSDVPILVSPGENARHNRDRRDLPWCR